MAEYELNLYRNYTKQQRVATLLGDQIVPKTADTEAGFGYRKFEFDIPDAAADMRDMWTDQEQLYWMSHAELLYGGFRIFEGQLAEIVDPDDGSNKLDCTVIGYYNALTDDSISALHNYTSLAAVKYGQTVQGFMLHTLDNIPCMKRLQRGDILGPSIAYDRAQMAEPLTIKEYLDTLMGRSAESKFVVYPWDYFIWEDRKLHTQEMKPTTVNWLATRRPGNKMPRRLTLDGYYNSVIVDYADSPSRRITNQFTDSDAVRRLEYERLLYRREKDLTDQQTAINLAGMELQARHSAVQFEIGELSGGIQDTAFRVWPNFFMRAGQTLRYVWSTAGAASNAQKDLVIYATSYSFANNAMTVTVNSHPPHLVFSKDGSIHAV